MNKYFDMSLSAKLKILTCIMLVPMAVLVGLLLVLFGQYGARYDEIVRNITVANNYNIRFKEEIDYAMYQVVIGAARPDALDDNPNIVNPLDSIVDAERVFKNLYKITSNPANKTRIGYVLKSLNTLRDRILEIMDNTREGGHYDENIFKLDTNVRILTDIIQEQIQHYIYYEAQSLENTRQELASEFSRTRNISVMALIMVVFITWWVAEFISRSISKPMQKLCATAKLVSEGDFEARAASDSSGDEVKMLSASFNSMLEKISGLMEDIKTEQLNLRATELKLLQAQINPHFLYNTLDTIVWMIEGGENSQAVEMVTTLSEFFRTTLSKGRDDITLLEEEQHITSYLTIQRFRYSDILQFSIDIPEELNNYRIQKLTLQPIVENALYHGIKNKRGLGSINVNARLRGKNIVIVVEDDGMGMDELRLRQVRKVISGEVLEPTESGFGLANVDKRIKLNWGRAYGIKIDSEYGVGTEVTVTIPARL